MSAHRGSIYRRWVIANSVGELLGLGATLAIGAALFSGLAESNALGAVLLTATLMTATGGLEGLIVGLAQWSVVRDVIPGFTRRKWVMATILGAVLAWLLGSIPMAVGSLSATSEMGQVQEPSGWLVMALSSALGLFAGLILSLAQWWALRGQVDKAWRWLPANALAWAVGMPLIFVGIDLGQLVQQPILALLAVAVAIALAGAIVGAIHGFALIAFITRK